MKDVKKIVLIMLVIALVVGTFVTVRVTTENHEKKESEEMFLVLSEAYAYEFRDMAYITDNLKLVYEIQDIQDEMLKAVAEGNVEELLKLQEESKPIIEKVYSVYSDSPRPAWIEQALEAIQRKLDNCEASMNQK